MLEKFRSAVIGASMIVVLLGVAAYLFVSMGGGSKLFGDGGGSLDPVDFAAMSYDTPDTGFLLCDLELCGNAIPDGSSAAFTATESALRLALIDFTEEMPTIRTLNLDIINNQFEFAERLPGTQYPAVISAKIYGAADGSSRLALYSYQPVGDSTEQDHEDRITRWLRMIEARLVQ